MSLDERQRVVKQTFTPAELAKMTPEQLVALIGEAGPGARLQGRGVVRKANGEIRYAPKAVPGDYGESPEELAAQKESSGD